jgi:hypothetical protein
LDGVASNTTEEPEQVGLLPEDIAMDTEGLTVALTVMVIPDDVTLAGLAQLKEEVILQVMTSPSENEDEVKVVLLAPPIGLPFRFHWYEGLDPPSVAFTVKVTEAPEHVGLEPEVIEIPAEGVTLLKILIVIPGEETVAGLAQFALEVMTHVKTSPSEIALVE